MKLARAMFGGLCLFFGFACSSPAPDPSRGAVSALVGPNNSGSQCIMIGPVLEIPNDGTPGDVNHEVTCTPGPGCDPTASMAEDGKNSASIQCSVKQSGNNYSVSVSASLPGVMSFSGSGVLTSTGGTNFHVFLTNAAQARSGSDGTCTITVKSISPGKVLATYSCPNFDVPNIAGSPGCIVTGGFVFDRCDS